MKAKEEEVAVSSEFSFILSGFPGQCRWRWGGGGAGNGKQSLWRSSCSGVQSREWVSRRGAQGRGMRQAAVWLAQREGALGASNQWARQQGEAEDSH